MCVYTHEGTKVHVPHECMNVMYVNCLNNSEIKFAHTSVTGTFV